MERDHQSVGTALRDTLGTTRESVKMWTSVRWSRCALVVPTVRILPGHMTVKRLLSAELLWSEGCDECKSGYRMEENICVGEWACAYSTMFL
ncbi:uncharacterized protein LOC135347129 isoform X1 [Halichondria panicea]|uniref:uncharacterized protein LOC135347129 isoform X1 n=1 Tax=Halichondria panicea TaxID=6063 RepID=UPI00312B5D52